MTDPENTIAFQGELGANSHMACIEARPELSVLPCQSFEEMLAAVQEKRAVLAMVPVENSVAGRVADIHHLLPGSGLHIVDEHFQRVNAMLLGLKGTKPEELEELLTQEKFSTLNIKGLKFNPFLRKWSKSSDLSVNYIISSLKN